MNDDDEFTTADQDAWVALFTGVQLKLAELVPLIPAMKVDEIKTLVDAMQAAMWGHHQAATFDHRNDLETKRVLPT